MKEKQSSIFELTDTIPNIKKEIQEKVYPKKKHDKIITQAIKQNKKKYTDQDESKFEYKRICDNCANIRCLEYDVLTGAKHIFGDGEVSEDMAEQYNEYCKKRIKKTGCLTAKEKPLII